MKKLTTIIALALIVTIGSVYAGWTYFQGGATGADARTGLSMSTVSYDGTKGTITADTTALTILVDDMSTVEGSDITTKYTAGLRGAGDIKIQFTPKDGADATVQSNGIKMKAIISVEKVGAEGTARKYHYNGKDYEILSAKNENSFEITLNDGNATKNTTITAQQIIDALIFCEDADILLPTKADNDTFAAAMSDYKIHIDIEEIA